MQLQQIFIDCGLTVNHCGPVHGGDINQAYHLHTTAAEYFLKVNDAHLYPGMFKKEADGLQALRRHSSLVVPEVITEGVTGNQQYLLLQWLLAGQPKADCFQNFGTAVAQQHLHPQPFFGWHQSNFIGSVTQLNTQQTGWHFFYAGCRLMPLVQQLFNAGAFTKSDLAAAESLCNQLDQLFPHEPPALLHGDLWSGNYLVTQSGYAAIFDPAVYCGHREMDIGMSKLFGGFSQQFYEAYNEAYPLQSGWQQRLPLTQLYPLLVHAVLFGGHYINSAQQIIKQFGG